MNGFFIPTFAFRNGSRVVELRLRYLTRLCPTKKCIAVICHIVIDKISQESVETKKERVKITVEDM